MHPFLILHYTKSVSPGALWMGQGHPGRDYSYQARNVSSWRWWWSVGDLKIISVNYSDRILWKEVWILSNYLSERNVTHCVKYSLPILFKNKNNCVFDCIYSVYADKMDGIEISRPSQRPSVCSPKRICYSLSLRLWQAVGHFPAMAAVWIVKVLLPLNWKSFSDFTYRNISSHLRYFTVKMWQWLHLIPPTRPQSVASIVYSQCTYMYIRYK